MENLNPCKIETLEQIDTQFVRIDYFHERNVWSKFGKHPFTGDFWAKGWNITFLRLFYFFFSDQRWEETPGRILTRNGSKDAESRKDVPFWVIKSKTNEIWPIYTPKSLKEIGPEQEISSQNDETWNSKYTESTEPIEMKI